jgi:poly(A) polymerase
MEPVFAKVDLPDADPLFQAARKVVVTLRNAGFDAWIAGGAVRDRLLGKLPKDWDVATSAEPGRVMALFPKTVTVGIQFGVVRVRLSGFEIEVATFRAETGYVDGRRPGAVRFTDVREDVLRRDFTINGLVLDPVSGEVLDWVGGIADLEARLIRAIGDPEARLAEDHLRALRALRFAARTGFRVEPATFAAIRAHADDVRRVSAERIQEETSKLLASGRPGLGLSLMKEGGILGAVFPELDATWDERAPEVLDRLSGASLPTLWAALAWPLGEEAGRRFLVRLRHSRQAIDAAAGAIRCGRLLPTLPHPDVAVEKRILRETSCRIALDVMQARFDVYGGPDAAIRHARARFEEWDDEALFPSRLVDGRDAVIAGLLGPAVGRVLREIEDAQLRGEVRDRAGALRMLEEMAG